MKPFIYFILLVMSMVLIAVLPHSREFLALQPQAGLLQEQQLWRWVSAHFSHASWAHLGLNLLNLTALRAIFIRWLLAQLSVALILFSALFISAGLILTSPLQSYVGFSGVFYSLLIFLLLQQWHSQKLIYSVAVIIVIAKITYEQMAGANHELEQLIGISVASDANAWGALAGSILGGGQRWHSHKQ